MAAKAEAPIEAGSQFGPATARLARIVRAVKSAATAASGCLSLSCLLSIDSQQQGEKRRVLNKGMAHWCRLLAW
jgi:hypothetical protein